MNKVCSIFSQVLKLFSRVSDPRPTLRLTCRTGTCLKLPKPVPPQVRARHRITYSPTLSMARRSE